MKYATIDCRSKELTREVNMKSLGLSIFFSLLFAVSSFGETCEEVLVCKDCYTTPYASAIYMARMEMFKQQYRYNVVVDRYNQAFITEYDACLELGDKLLAGEVSVREYHEALIVMSRKLDKLVEVLEDPEHHMKRQSRPFGHEASVDLYIN